MTTLGIIGAGNIGSQLARLGVANGYDVVVSNSRGPATLESLIEELGPRARAALPAEAAAAGDLVIVTIPLHQIHTLPLAELAGKLVIDTNNYYPQRDGNIVALDEETTTTAELLQELLPDSRVVKAFNHIYAADLTTDGLPAGTEDRRALVIAGNDPDSREVVTALLNTFGFDTVDLGPLTESWRIQRDTPGYGPRLDAFELREAVSAAVRYRDMPQAV
ncbi:NADPH-dependent F420 reductase [Cryobacterium sp. SO2]|uniref:NADPH-dependent F420 reductase n=1 Tax=Cryobacterium sp. SO2 TaxID=1897060 RepID=UPI00223D399E|nr:NADPH-dependent F420 reductase [Cryobacterium sp. SO2]WEO78248.1 NADPH-dependent F420 reductase [Cryobacterium sp. SO2]